MILAAFKINDILVENVIKEDEINRGQSVGCSSLILIGLTFGITMINILWIIL